MQDNLETSLTSISKQMNKAHFKDFLGTESERDFSYAKLPTIEVCFRLLNALFPSCPTKTITTRSSLFDQIADLM